MISSLTCLYIFNRRLPCGNINDTPEYFWVKYYSGIPCACGFIHGSWNTCITPDTCEHCRLGSPDLAVALVGANSDWDAGLQAKEACSNIHWHQSAQRHQQSSINAKLHRSDLHVRTHKRSASLRSTESTWCRDGARHASQFFLQLTRESKCQILERIS